MTLNSHSQTSKRSSAKSTASRKVTTVGKSIDKLLTDLKERAKELNCLYEVEEIMSETSLTLEETFRKIVARLPAGWQYPDVCQARIVYEDSVFESEGYRDTPWVQHADILLQDEIVGRISVCYTEERPPADEGPFLKEERKLINAVADRLKHRILYQNLKKIFEREKHRSELHEDWEVIIDLLQRTDPKLLTRISRRMLNYLTWAGLEEARSILERVGPVLHAGDSIAGAGENRPLQISNPLDLLTVSEDIFRIAARHLDQKEILENIRKWIQEDRTGFLVRVLENLSSPLAEIATAIEKFRHLIPKGIELSLSRELSLRVSLIRRLLSDCPQFVQTAKRFISIDDFHDLLQHTLFPPGSHGRIGGKAAGLLVASQILKKASDQNELLAGIRTPKTWHITSDGILDFINYNDLEEIIEHKYKDLGQVRQEYPYIVQVFKKSSFPPELVNGLSLALDDLGDVPLIVRSSSLLEDSVGTSFAGKYKSLFIANRGSKQQRLQALMDAIAEVYASTFGPDPIGYRSERGLLDFHEEMGILIQEVVGTRIGPYYLPAFAGVVFSRNEFQWSQRIRREDGLLRLVPGLGTRAVDRMLDDYPILASPAQPSLHVNLTVEEKVRYSPKYIDVINLESGLFETIPIRDLLREHGDNYPLVHQIVSILQEDRLVLPLGLGIDKDRDMLVVTFEGLLSRTQFVQQVWDMVQTLQSEFQMPVDVEFAHDGTNLFILQCRPQSYSAMTQPAVMTRDVAEERILFSANRFVSNGTVSGITHVVYVDPQQYSSLARHSDLLAVGQAIGRLNQILPKRQFILMGPSRWGSRGDIRLGVSVSYSDINNTAMLIEIAHRQKDYIPELSFGTHFFQDLVESCIRYLPLYPGDAGTIFREEFLLNAHNWLPELLPEFAHLSDTIRVVDVSHTTSGLVLQVLMNAEQNEALGILSQPETEPIDVPLGRTTGISQLETRSDAHWRWRLRSAERLAQMLDPERFGVKGVYLLGSTKNATAGPQSDIDLLIHFAGTPAQNKELLTWLEGWSQCLAHINYLRTGYQSEGLLDVHIITDEDIRNRTSYAVKINAATDAARLLPMGIKKGRIQR